MKLKVLGSNSSGNCYILENEHEALIIEAGISFSRVRSALGLKPSLVVGCLVSHKHGDHARHIEMYAKSGINILASESVFDARPIGRHREMGIVIEPGNDYVLGDFSVSAFRLNHDVPCLGFLIDHPDTGLIAFVTDTCSCDYIIPGLNHIIVECNYSTDILEANIKSGQVDHTRGRRVLLTHMELENCKKTLLLNDLDNVRNIVLAHLSRDNSDAVRFRGEISALTGKNVVVAEKDTEINFKL
jgi:phosphoribosyl 1,2-cyclic phosphodiesterase